MSVPGNDAASKALADLPDWHFPGGRKPSRNYEVVKNAHEPISDWDTKPIVKALKGVDTEFFSIKALADAVGMQPVTIRKWESKGWLPVSRYRTAAPKSIPLEGKTPQGNRLYTRAQVETVIEAAGAAGILEKARRPDWKIFTKIVVDGWRKTS